MAILLAAAGRQSVAESGSWQGLKFLRPRRRERPFIWGNPGSATAQCQATGLRRARSRRSIPTRQGRGYRFEPCSAYRL